MGPLSRSSQGKLKVPCVLCCSGIELDSALSTAGGSLAKRAFITGTTGHDGSYVAELLLKKGYEVPWLIRRASTFNTARIDHLYVDSRNI